MGFYHVADAKEFWVWHWADASGEFPLPLRRRTDFVSVPANTDSTWNRNLVAHMIHWPGHLRAGERVPRRRPEMHIPAVATRGAEARPKICLELRSAGHKIFSRRGAGNFLFRTTVAGTEKAHSWSLTRHASTSQANRSSVHRTHQEARRQNATRKETSCMQVRSRRSMYRW